jgi:hypothetical protein
MKKSLRSVLLVFSFAFFGLFTLFQAFSNTGGPGGGYTNAPNESNCTSCHSGSLNPNTANLANFTLSGNFTGGGYIPDSTYSITISYAQSGINKFGFQVTALRQSNNFPAGTLTSGTGNQKRTNMVQGRIREYIEHTSAGTSGSGSRSWTFSWTAPSTIQDTIIFYAVVNATNSNSATSGDQIYAKTFKIAASSLLPVASIALSKPTVCVGDTITYYGIGTNNTASYRWKFNTGSPNTANTQNVVRSYASAGNFRDTLWVTNNKGESKPAAVTVQVVALPQVSITNNSGIDTACQGNVITLSTATGNGFRYRWNSGPTDTLATVQVNKSGAYTVAVTNNNGCTNVSNARNIVFVTRPSLTLTPSNSNSTICEGNQIILSANSGYKDYSFYQDTNLLQHGNSANLTVSDTGTYRIYAVTDFNYCKLYSDTIQFRIEPLLDKPSLRCGNKTQTSLTFEWNALTKATAYEVSRDKQNWQTPSSGFNGLSHVLTNHNADEETTLYVRGLNTNSLCITGKFDSIKCKTLPCANISYKTTLSDSAVCLGDSVKAEISNLNLTNYAISFNGSKADTAKSFWFIPNQNNKVLEISVSDLNTTCPPVKQQLSVAVDTISEIAYNLPNKSICLGKNLQLEVKGKYNSYEFFKNGISLQQGSVANFSYVGIQNGDRIWAKTRNGVCERVGAEEMITVNVPIKPGFTSEETGIRTYRFTDTTTNINSRIWSKIPDLEVLGGNQVVNYTFPNEEILYVVTLRTLDINGCEDSAKKLIQIQKVGVSSVNATLAISLWPNPLSGILNIQTGELEGVQYKLYDTKGSLMQQGDLTSGTNTISVSGLSSGMYWIEMLHSSGVKKEKLVIQKAF